MPQLQVLEGSLLRSVKEPNDRRMDELRHSSDLNDESMAAPHTSERAVTASRSRRAEYTGRVRSDIVAKGSETLNPKRLGQARRVDTLEVWSTVHVNGLGATMGDQAWTGSSASRITAGDAWIR